MKPFWRKIMIYNEDEKNTKHQISDCECCYCKKIFMGLVILILTFMAGIMVGNCGRCHYSDNYYQNHYHHKKNKHKKLHKGMHQMPIPTQNQTYPDNQAGGFVIEIDETN